MMFRTKAALSLSWVLVLVLVSVLVGLVSCDGGGAGHDAPCGVSDGGPDVSAWVETDAAVGSGGFSEKVV